MDAEFFIPAKHLSDFEDCGQKVNGYVSGDS